MEYHGKLYGKIAGTYFDTGSTTEDYDSLVNPEIAISYAEFCVKCDRENLPIICLTDFIKKYNNGKH